MKFSNTYLLTILLTLSFLYPACKSLSRTQKGAAVGTVAGGGAGAVIGRAAGNTAMGAVIGAVVGGVTGAVIGKKMDKQAEEIKRDVPGVTVERVGEGITIEFASNILFGFDNYGLTTEAQSGLNKLIAILDKYPDTDIEIHGHTDSKGSDSYNMTLSKKRAKAVSSYLINHRIASSRIKTIGFGEREPKYSNDTEDGQSKNRRVEFAISANEKMKQDAKNESN
ncbi:MAG: OmpA family protein [Bacteroidota bacterium]|nr:OmpA family protein [Bacteroidota bacterium]